MDRLVLNETPLPAGLQHTHAIRPFEFWVLPNYPNPFNPDTWIPFELDESGPVSVEIYDATGRLVRVLPGGYREAGLYASRTDAVYWDGRGSAGESVTSGPYFYQLRAGASSGARRMVVRK